MTFYLLDLSTLSALPCVVNVARPKRFPFDDGLGLSLCVCALEANWDRSKLCIFFSTNFVDAINLKVAVQIFGLNVPELPVSKATITLTVVRGDTGKINI